MLLLSRSLGWNTVESGIHLDLFEHSGNLQAGPSRQQHLGSSLHHVTSVWATPLSESNALKYWRSILSIPSLAQQLLIYGYETKEKSLNYFFLLLPKKISRRICGRINKLKRLFVSSCQRCWRLYAGLRFQFTALNDTFQNSFLFT